MTVSFTKKMRRLSLLCTSLLLVVLGGGAGCAPPPPGAQIPREFLPGARRSHTNPNAPRTVESTELRSFFASFFYRNPYIWERSTNYFVTLKNEDGAWRLDRGGKTITITQEEVDELEQLIRTYDLASLNGISENINGLPPTLGGYAFSASYASGEKISASNNQGAAPAWGAFRRPFVRYLDRLFIAAGYQEFAYPPEVFQIERFSMEFCFLDGEDFLIRSIVLLNRQVKGSAYSLQELAEEKIDKEDFALFLMDDTMRKTPDGNLIHESTRYLPYDEALLKSLSDVIEEEGLADRAEEGWLHKRHEGTPQKNESVTINVVYKSGRAFHFEHENETQLPREAFVPERILTWADTVFADAENEAKPFED